MTSRTSFCNRTLLRKNITRFWPLWSLFTFLLFLVFTMPILTGLFSGRGLESTRSTLETATSLIETHVVSECLVLCPYAIVCAVCCFGYLHRTRSAYMLHAFPVSRGILFRTNLISGLLFMAVPWTAICGIDLLLASMLQAESIALLLGALLQSYALGLLTYLFFYGLAVFCMNMTGRAVHGVLLYCLLNYLPVVLEGLTRLLIEPLLYGYDFSSSELFTALSPAINLLLVKSGLSVPVDSVDFLASTVLPNLWIYEGVIAAVGAALMALAWCLYRRRRMESCGEAIAFPFARPIVKYLVALLSALFIGYLTRLILFGATSAGRFLPTMLFLLIGGFIGFFGAEMLLRRSARVFKKRAWVGYGCFAAIVLLAFACIRFDWLGIVRYVPQVEQVEYAVVGTGTYFSESLGLKLTSEEDVAKLTKFQKELMEHRTENFDYTGYDELCLTYHLKNGKTVRRIYSRNALEVEEQPLNSQIDALLTRGDLNGDYFDRLLSETDRVNVTDYGTYNSTSDFTLSSKQIAELRECLVRDAQEGNIYAFDKYNTYSDDYVYRITLYGDGFLNSFLISKKAKATTAFLKTVWD